MRLKDCVNSSSSSDERVSGSLSLKLLALMACICEDMRLMGRSTRRLTRRPAKKHITSPMPSVIATSVGILSTISISSVTSLNVWIYTGVPAVVIQREEEMVNS